MLKPEHISVEVVERRDDPGVWSVEAINTDGSIEMALFPGPNSKDRATEYAAWRYGLAEAADEITRLRAEVERLREWNREIALNAREFVAENERLRAALEDCIEILDDLKWNTGAVERARAALGENTNV